jgi:WD40 repeat protein
MPNRSRISRAILPCDRQGRLDRHGATRLRTDIRQHPNAENHPPVAAQFFVEERLRRVDVRTELTRGRAEGVGRLQGMPSLDSCAAVGAVAAVNVEPPHDRPGRQIGLPLRPRLIIHKLRRRAAGTVRRQRQVADFVRRLLGDRPPVVLPIVVAGLATGPFRIGHGRPFGEEHWPSMHSGESIMLRVGHGRPLGKGSGLPLAGPFLLLQPLQQRLDLRGEPGDLRSEPDGLGFERDVPRFQFSDPRPEHGVLRLELGHPPLQLLITGPSTTPGRHSLTDRRSQGKITRRAVNWYSRENSVMSSQGQWSPALLAGRKLWLRELFAAAVLLASVGVVCAQEGRADSPPESGESSRAASLEYLREVTELLRGRRFDKLEERAAKLRRENPRLPTGLAELRAFYGGLSETLPGEPVEAYDERWRLLEEWKQEAPESITPRIALADLCVQYGWVYAPDGLARRLELPEGQSLTRLFERAEQELTDALELAEEKDVQDVELIRAALALARRQNMFGGKPVTPESMFEVMRQGLAIDPTNESVVANVALFLLPQAREHPEVLRQFADDVLELTRDHAGHALYATVVFETWPSYGVRLFQHFDFSWDKTRQGFRDQLCLHPDSNWILNKFCLLATIAGDRQTAHELFTKLGNDWDRSLWKTVAYYESRRRWARPDALTGQQRKVLEGHSGAVMAVGFSPDGRRLATGGTDRRVVIWDAETGESGQVLVTPHRRAVTSVVFSPDGSLLATTGYDNSVQLWDVDTQAARPLGAHTQAVRRLAFSPRGDWVAAAAADGSVTLWPTVIGAQERSLSPAHGKAAYGVAFSPDGSRLASVGGDGRLKVWDVETGRLLQNLPAHSFWAAAVAWSPEDNLLATAGADHLVKLWQLERDQPTAIFREARQVVYDVTISPSGNRLLAVSMDPANTGTPGEVLLWDLESRKLLARLTGHKGAVWAGAFSPDGHTAATASNDGTVRLWDVP